MAAIQRLRLGRGELRLVTDLTVEKLMLCWQKELKPYVWGTRAARLDGFGASVSGVRAGPAQRSDMDVCTTADMIPRFGLWRGTGPSQLTLSIGVSM
jgi:hypothetical protein